MILTSEEKGKIIKKYKDFKETVKTINFKNDFEINFTSSFCNRGDRVIKIKVYCGNRAVYVGGCGYRLLNLFSDSVDMDYEFEMALDVLKNKNYILNEMQNGVDNLIKELNDILI